MPDDKTLGFSVRFSEVHIWSTGASDVFSGIPERVPKLQANSASGHSKVSATMMSTVTPDIEPRSMSSLLTSTQPHVTTARNLVTLVST